VNGSSHFYRPLKSYAAEISACRQQRPGGDREKIGRGWVTPARTRAIRYVIPTFCSLGGDFLHFPHGGGGGGRHFAACCSLGGYERPTEVPDAHDTALYTAHTHTDTQDTFAHGPLGVERGSPDARSRDLRGRETARLHRWNKEDPALKGQPHEILDFSALWKTKQFILR
jgi:hypothetical protein